MRCTVERTFHYTDARGDDAELEVAIDIEVTHPRGEPIYCEYFAAAYRNRVGQWIDVMGHEWLADWVRDQFEAIDEGELYAVSGCGF